MASDTFLVVGSISAAVACIVAVLAKTFRDKTIFAGRGALHDGMDEIRVLPQEKEGSIASAFGRGEMTLVNVGGQRYVMPTVSLPKTKTFQEFDFTEFDLTAAAAVAGLQGLQPQVTLELEGGSSIVLKGNIASKPEIIRKLLDENNIHVVNVLLPRT